MLAIAHALVQAKPNCPPRSSFLGNVGEEGEGDLRGVRHLYNQTRWPAASPRTLFWTARARTRPSRRPWAAAASGSRSPAPAATALPTRERPTPLPRWLRRLALLARTPLPEEPRTTLNLGTIHGGTSVNSIPESAQASIDFRSTVPEQLVRLEVALHRAVEDAVDALQCAGKGIGIGANRGLLAFTIDQDRRPPRRAAARGLPAAGRLCAPWTAIWACEPTSPGLDRCQHSALAGRSGLVHGRGRRGRRRAHPGRVVLRQGSRDGPEARAAACAGDG
jgi:hypothetical protein